MSELYRFADFELDGARFELRRAGCAITVQPKVLRLLLLLVAERGRVVGTEELFRVLWPGERVGIGSVRRAVLGLRRVLGEHADSQHSVRTVRGFGYQFVRPVSTAAPAALPTPIHAPAAPLRMADTLPLYGSAAERLRLDPPLGWQTRPTTTY